MVINTIEKKSNHSLSHQGPHSGIISAADKTSRSMTVEDTGLVSRESDTKVPSASMKEQSVIIVPER